MMTLTAPIMMDKATVTGINLFLKPDGSSVVEIRYARGDVNQVSVIKDTIQLKDHPFITQILPGFPGLFSRAETYIASLIGATVDE